MRERVNDAHRLCVSDLFGLLPKDELLLSREHLVDAFPVEHRDLRVELFYLSDQLLCSWKKIGINCNIYGSIKGHIDACNISNVRVEIVLELWDIDI